VSTVRPIPIADHLWEALERMAQEMGVDRDALVNQALHALARAHGYVVPGAGPRVVSPPSPPKLGAAAAQVLETAERLERDMALPSPVPAAAKAPELLLVRDDGREAAVESDRFVIGRGRHCDLVIDSAKVSREHAAIVRHPDGWFIEDLGSSNGTWFRGEKIARRRVADGDEYFVSGERLRCRIW
jgi:FHA domain